MALADTYLTDILHVKDMGATASGDRALISGEDNLLNALFHNLVTTPGSLIHRPNFGVGIKSFQNRISRLSEQQALALRIKSQFELDPRVEAVSSVKVIYDQTNPSKTVLAIKIKPVGREELTFRSQPFGGI